MDILDDLNLIDFPDDFNYDLDFDLDDILFEFSTPGLFAVPEIEPVGASSARPPSTDAPEPEPVGASSARPQSANAPEPEPVGASSARPQSTTEPTDDPTITFAAIIDEDISPAPEEPLPTEDIPVEEGCTVVFSAVENLSDAAIGAAICRPLSTDAPELEPVGASIARPPSTDPEPDSFPPDEDDVRVYEAPDPTVPAEDLSLLETVPFTAVADLSAPVGTDDSSPRTSATPGFFAKLAGMVTGLFAGKKSAPAPAATAEPAPLPAEDADDESLPIFSQNPLTEDEETTEDILLFMPDSPKEPDAQPDTDAPETEPVGASIARPLSTDAQPDTDIFAAPTVEEQPDEVILLCEDPIEEDLPVMESFTPVEDNDALDKNITLQETIPFAAVADTIPDTDALEVDTVGASSARPLSTDAQLNTDVSEEPIADFPMDATLRFEAPSLEAASADAPSAHPSTDTPGIFAKLAGMVTGLFAGRSKPAKTTAVPAAEPEELPVYSFDGLLDDADSAEDILLFMSDIPEEPIAEPLSTEDTRFPEEPIDAPEIEPVGASSARPLSTDAPETEPVGASSARPLSTDAETDTDLPVEDDYPLIIDDLLFEFGDEDTTSYVPTLDIPDDDVQVYTPAEETSSLDDDLRLLETVPFTAVSESEASAGEAACRPQPTPASGLFTKLAGAAMGLLSGLLPKKQAPAPAAYEPAPAADAFAGMEDLFAEQGLSFTDEDVDPALLLELEMAAEREAELLAAAAAEDAHDQLVQTPDPELAVPDAVLEAQQEQEAAIRAAEEEAARLAAEDAEYEAPLSAEEEAKLFAWLDSLSPSAPTVEAADPASRPFTDAPEFEPVGASSARPLTIDAPTDADDLHYAPQPEYTPVYGLDAEDAPAALMPELTIDDEETEPEIDETEPVSPEALQDSLDMAEQLRHQEESPAEAAARRAKEDAELRYVPDEPPAKVIGARIAGRLGAVFSIFTQSNPDPGEDEEALGPEVPPSKAYRYFDKYVNGFRFRLRISVVLCILIAWISLGLPVFGSLTNPAVAAAACLMIQLAVMLAGADILATGVRGLLNRKPGLQSMLLLSNLAAVLDAAVIILTQGAAGYLPFCAVSAISLCFAIYGSLLYCRAQRFTFRALEQAVEPMTIGVDYGIVDEETTTVYRVPGHPEQFIHRSEEEDLSETVYGVMGPALTVAIPVLALFAALVSKSLGDFFHIMAAMFAAASAFGAMVAFPLPYFMVQRDLYPAKAAIAGWAGTKELGRVATMIVTDRDLFPDETVSIDSVRIVDSVPPELTLSYFCSLILKSDSCLAPAFTQLAENNDCELLPVEDFKCHEAGGLSGTIGPDEVLVASHSYMKLQGFRIPARKKDSENALFLAVNGHVIAYIMINYRPLKSVREGLASAISGNVEMVFAARDFNVTPLLISKKFKSPTDTLRFPSYEQRFEITEHGGSDTSTCAAVVSRKSFYSYAMVVKKARTLYSSVSWATILSAMSALLGVVLMFVMALTATGAAVTVGRLLIFMFLFALPTLALCVSITK